MIDNFIAKSRILSGGGKQEAIEMKVWALEHCSVMRTVPATYTSLVLAIVNLDLLFPDISEGRVCFPIRHFDCLDSSGYLDTPNKCHAWNVWEDSI